MAKKNIFFCYASPKPQKCVISYRKTKVFLKMPMTDRFRQKLENITKKTIFFAMMAKQIHFFCYRHWIFRNL